MVCMQEFIADALAVFRPDPVDGGGHGTALCMQGDLAAVQVGSGACHIDGDGGA